jgi:predicted Rossmann fold nucleotide-binding protein DprA/Smf involved in DNA uptake
MFIGGIIYFFVAKTRSWRAGSFAKESFEKEKDKIREDIEYGRKLLESTDKELQRISKLPPDQQQAMLPDIVRRRKQAQDIIKAGQQSLKIIGQQEKEYLQRLKKLEKGK